MPKKWNADIMFPNDTNYIIRPCGVQFQPSNAGNPQLIMEFEVVAPQEVEVAGEMVTLAGVKVKNYYPVTVFEDDGKTIDETRTKDARERLVKLYVDGFGITDVDIDYNNPDTKVLLGKPAYAHLKPEVTEQRKAPNATQIEAAKKLGKRPEGDLLKNPITGKVLIKYWPRLEEIFGPAPAGGTMGY